MLPIGIFHCTLQLLHLSVLVEHFARDHNPLDLGRPFVYLRYPGVAIIPFGRHVRHVTHATQNLYALVRIERGRLGRGQLGHGRFLKTMKYDLTIIIMITVRKWNVVLWQ